MQLSTSVFFVILSLQALTPQSSTAVNNSIFGDITKIDTTGASAETANSVRPNKGVKASEKLAEEDLKRLKQYKDIIKKVAKAEQVDPALIAAIISRESRAGKGLKDGWNPSHSSFGLMQINKCHRKRKGAWNSKEHITQATQILKQYIKAIQKKFPKWTKEQQLKGGIAAYNAGPGNIESYDKVDEKTAGKDYSNDVVARAKWLKRHGF